jgi:hypothetical protein
VEAFPYPSRDDVIRKRPVRRMEKAGAIITTMDQIVSELAIAWTTPNGSKLSKILAYH